MTWMILHPLLLLCGWNYEEIIMPTYLTTAELARYMHMSESLIDDTLSEFVLDTAEDVIRDYLEHEPLETEFTERYDGNNGEALILTGHPVIEITTVTESNISLADDTAVELTEDIDYAVDYEKGILYRIATVWKMGVQNISVEYKYGQATVPNRAKVVGYQVANRIYLFGQDEAASSGSWSATYVKGGARLTDDEIFILRNMKR